MAGIPALESFITRGPLSIQCPKWRLWVERLDLYVTGTEVTAEWKRALFLHLAGVDSYKFSKTLTEAGPPHTYETLVAALNVYFEPMANPDYERVIFR